GRPVPGPPGSGLPGAPRRDLARPGSGVMFRDIHNLRCSETSTMLADVPRPMFRDIHILGGGVPRHPHSRPAMLESRPESSRSPSRIWVRTHRCRVVLTQSAGESAHQGAWKDLRRDLNAWTGLLFEMRAEWK